MRELRDLARQLLAEGQVQVVIGWEEGPNGARAAFVREAEEAERLIFDERCVHNLSAYLSPRRPHMRRLGKAAVVVKPCDARSVAVLLRENQLKREDVVLIGVRCGGVLADPASKLPLGPETVSERCPGCESREPSLADYVVGDAVEPPPAGSRRDAQLAELEAMPAAGRWAFWQEHFSRCTRCNACRQVCPLCACERCVADKTEPQWIDSSATPRGVLAWHLTRAQHHAGRCADCGECARACPAGIPLGLLNRQVARIVERRFGYVASDDPTVPAPVGAFRAEDGQEFIR